MSYYYEERAQYRCSTCGRRCGPNGHAGCGRPELINGIPALLVPFFLGLIWFGMSFVVGPVCLLLGGGLWEGWWTLGKIVVGLSFVLAVIGTAVGAAEKKKHKQYKPTMDPIKDAHLDIINKEYNNGR